MSESAALFPVGTRVRKKKNIEKIGTISDGVKPGKWTKQLVRWDSGDGASYEIIQTLEKFDESKEETVLELLLNNKFGDKKNLRLAITQQRLSGQLENVIYSLNLTNTHFYAYQFRPLVSFLRSRNNALLIADEVGLGKTIEAGLIWTELQMRDQAKRMLVICPAALCHKWALELKDKFNQKAEIVNAAGLEKAIREIRAGDRINCILIVSIQGVRPPSDSESRSAAASLSRYLQEIAFDSSAFDLLIIDEAHTIRNTETRSYKFVDLIRPLCRAVLMLSATPIQTSLDNLFSLLNMLDPSYFPSLHTLQTVIDDNSSLVDLCRKLASEPMTNDELRAGIDDLIAESTHEKRDELISWSKQVPSYEGRMTETDRARFVAELSKLNPLSQVMTRTLKRDVIQNRVIRQAFVCKVEPTDAEREFYKEITDGIRQFCIEYGGRCGFVEVIAQRMMSSCSAASLNHWLSQITDEEYDEYDTDEDDDEEIGDKTRRSAFKGAICRIARDFQYKAQLRERDSKFERLLETVRNYQLSYPGKKILLFAFFKSTLRYLQTKFKERGIKTLVYDGDVAKADRTDLISAFENNDEKILLSSEIAAEGIDLQFMNCVINYDLPWNPARIEQRIGRIDRIGQTESKIHIYNFVHEGTIDCQIYERLYERLAIFTQALGVAEVILGDELKKLERELLSRNLTPQQERDRIDQTRMAIENCIQQTNSTRGQTLLFDKIEQEIEEARRLERYVTDSDLYDYISLFLEKEGGGSKISLVDKDRRLYELDLGVQTRARFESFLMEHSFENLQTRLSEVNNIRPTICIHNKQEPQRDSIERITQNHPLIRFISHWFKQNKIKPLKTVSTKLNRAFVAKTYPDLNGNYLFIVNCWNSKGVNRSLSLLAYEVVDMQTMQSIDEKKAEFLVNEASLHGSDWFLSSNNSTVSPQLIDEAHDEANLALEDRFAKYKELETCSNSNTAAFQIRQFENLKENAKTKYENQIANDYVVKGREGRHKRYKNVYENRVAQLNLRIEEVQQKEKQFSIDESFVSAGLIHVGD